MPADPSAELPASNDAARVRLVLSRELETISHYEALAAAADAPHIRAFFLHLAAEEKEHVAEAVMVLRQLDQGQDAHFQRDVGTHLASLSAAGKANVTVGERPSVPTTTASDLRVPSQTERIVHALPFSPLPPAGAFTVGPLRTRR